ncbi:MAG: hypothetical protein KJP04_09695, partial [Arenicella sp.]|nr:hypothetical protein [Arenicella sp.]
MNEYNRLKQLDIPAPVAARKQSTVTYHKRIMSDPYRWLKDDSYPTVDDQQVLDYLTAENKYFNKFLDPHRTLVDTVFEEFKGRTDEAETSVPYIDNGYEYRWYYRAGEDYKTRSRKNLATGEEEIFLDETALAEGHEYFVLGDWSISPDNRYLAYSVDT